MYLDHWALQERPFENTPDPRFFYASEMHNEALTRLNYAMNSQKGCFLLTGEYGCGKTFLLRKALDSLDTNRFELVLLTYPIVTPTEFLREILLQEGVETKNNSRLELFNQVSALAFDNTKKGKYTLVVIDEAQLIQEPQVLEEIRLLLNLQLEDRFLINIFLAGQPELRERIMEHPQLEQRIGIKYHLHHMGLEDAINYIQHRLKIAGSTRELFTSEAYSLIYKFSRGIARRINNICDLCLLDGFTSGATNIDEEIVQKNL